MRKFRVVFRAALLSAALWLGCSVAAVEHPLAAPQSEHPPIVIVLSWDGMRHDYPDLAEFPGLDRMAREGARASSLRPVFPSSTFPGHVSMATGTYPDRHGIVGNRFYDSGAGFYHDRADADWIEAEPLWIAAERQGVSTATYFWVGSETDWRGQGTRYREAPFDGGRSERAKVDKILQWLTLGESERPRLIMSYWAGTDEVGHDRGPDSAAVVRQIQAQDAQLVRLLEGIDELGLWQRTTLIVVSDHGMTAAGDYQDLQGPLLEAGISARVIGGSVAQVYLEDPADAVAAGDILRQTLSQVPGSELYAAGQIPARLRIAHPTRSGDWLAIAPPPYVFTRPQGMEGVLYSAAYALGWDFGGHGYDAALPDMGGIFFAVGRAVTPGQALGEVRQIDLPATVAQLLNIDPPTSSEGHPLL